MSFQMAVCKGDDEEAKRRMSEVLGVVGGLKGKGWEGMGRNVVFWSITTT